MVVVNLHARVGGSFPGLGGLKETKKFFLDHSQNSVFWEPP